jgi:hypothetical protein
VLGALGKSVKRPLRARPTSGAHDMARLAALLLALAPLAASAQTGALYEYLKCRLCEVRAGSVDARLGAHVARRGPRGHAASLAAPTLTRSLRVLHRPPPPLAWQVQPVSGKIDDCCCDVESVDQANTRHFLPILHDLTQT